jgi:hypothetical protein
MPALGNELTIPASARPKADALDRAATCVYTQCINIKVNFLLLKFIFCIIGSSYTRCRLAFRKYENLKFEIT